MALFIPLILIAIAAGFFFAGDIGKSFGDIAFDLRPFKVDISQQQPEESNSAPQKAPQQKFVSIPLPPTTLQQTPPSDSTATVHSFILDTKITQGPSDGTTFSSTAAITFTFTGSTIPTNTEGNISFETFVDGIDTDWIPTLGSSRQITIPAGSRSYTFLVRSKLQGAVDFTPAKRDFGINVSPYFGKIRITSMSPSAKATDGARFSLTLRPTLSAGEQVTITGWKLESRWTGSFIIPMAIEKFHPSRTTQNSNPVIMTNANTVQMSGSGGPAGTELNFKTNQCFGYLQEFFSGLPGGGSCSRNKPAIADISHLTPSCQDFILNNVNYSGCESINYSNNLKVAGDAACKEYLSTTLPVLNYDTCYSANSNSPNFTENTWYMYTNRRFGHYLHDVIMLFDANNLIVDKYIY